MNDFVNFDWDAFRGNLVKKGKTIKEWCKEVELDYDRYSNIRLDRVKATEKEQELFKAVVEG